MSWLRTGFSVAICRSYFSNFSFAILVYWIQYNINNCCYWTLLLQLFLLLSFTHSACCSFVPPGFLPARPASLPLRMVSKTCTAHGWTLCCSTHSGLCASSVSHWSTLLRPKCGRLALPMPTLPATTPHGRPAQRRAKISIAPKKN